MTSSAGVCESLSGVDIATAAQRDFAAMQARYDVAILGGGLAGLTLGLQLARERPETSIVIAEKRAGPAPEAAFKVGESTVELSAYYFAEVCGMKDHLESEQLLKNGLRFFFPAGRNEDIAARAEWGPIDFPPADCYQLDRGRFENELMVRNQGRGGTDVLAGYTVDDVELQDGSDHVVKLSRGGESTEVEAGWVVDATGRTQLLKRKLGLEKPVEHTINACWLRLRGGLDIENWSEDEEWRARPAKPGQRMLSTNHLMGQGYWVWLIPLASGTISIGIVADPRYHPWAEISTLDGALRWLGEHEPQLAGELDGRRDEIEDFLIAEDFAYACQRVYSPERWALSGVAGVFIDPFYSPGSDHIAISNTYVCDLVSRDLDGEHDPERVETVNALFLRIFDGSLPVYENMYEVWGDPLVMSAKLGFDYAFYWGATVPRFMHGKWRDLPFTVRTLDLVRGATEVKSAIQPLFVDWHRQRNQDERSGFVPTLGVDALYGLARDLEQRLDDDALADKLARNFEVLKAVSVQIFHKAAGQCLGEQAPDPGAKVDAKALTLDPEQWEERGLFSDDGMTLEEARALAPGIDVLWFEDAASTT